MTPMGETQGHRVFSDLFVIVDYTVVGMATTETWRALDSVKNPSLKALWDSVSRTVMGSRATSTTKNTCMLLKGGNDGQMKKTRYPPSR